MLTNDLLLVLIVAALAFYAGYQFGRQSVLGSHAAPDSRAPGPMAEADPLPGPGSAPLRPRAAPPPASSGGDGDPSDLPQRAPPRRTAAPPPARAGLLDTDGPGSGGQSGSGGKAPKSQR